MNIVPCCELCGRPIRIGLLHTQQFIASVHQRLHALKDGADEYGRYKMRLARVALPTLPKVQQQFQTFIKTFQADAAAFQAMFDDPYFDKVGVHYPDVSQYLKAQRDMIMNSKLVQEMLRL